MAARARRPGALPESWGEPSVRSPL
jgi:hypothetical protein